jgi:hypothetical protein
MLDHRHDVQTTVRRARGPASSSARRLYNALGAPRPDRAHVLSAIELLEREPLACAGEFPGDLLRRLIDLPAGVWAREHDLHPRYREIVRVAALARRGLPEKERGAFWRALPERLEET